MTRPTIGRIVHYTLSEQDADEINRRRAHAHSAESLDGTQKHTGNAVKAGDVYPMTIVRVWGDTPESAVNGQVALDGNDAHWVTSVHVGDGQRTYTWPTRA